MKEQHGHTMEKEHRFRFGNYDLVRRIDVGGMGEVYLAKQRSAFDREVAIKIIREDLVNDATARQRFLREAEVSSHLKHEHILPLYEFGEEQERLFLVTPYIEGGTLARRLQNGPLPLSEVRQLFSALVNAVAYIHRRGVVHRDLKPSNILLDQSDDGQIYVRLIDFGIARIQGTAASPPLTTAGNEMGTIAYMAPERLSGVAAPSNDIYSLGVILYQMLTGYLPIDDQGRPQRVPLPQPLDDVVDRCMAPRINERFPSAEEVLAAFERACQQMGMATRMLPTASGEDAEDEVISLQRSTDVSPAVATFSLEDYNAPTTAVDASQIAGKASTQPILVGGSPRPPRARGQHRNLLFPIILFLAAAVLLTMSGVLVFQIFALPTATIHFSPQTHLVRNVFQIMASTSVTSVDVASASIPIATLNGSSTSSQTGSTGQSFDQSCGGDPSSCQQVVSSIDVDFLGTRILPHLESQIAQDSQQKLPALGATQVGPVQYTDYTPTQTVNPPIGSLSNKVTVTLTERWSVKYILNKDAQTLARQLLKQKMQTFGANYVPVDSTIQIGQPVVAAVGYRYGYRGGDVVPIEIPAAGYAKYRFSPSQLASIQDQIKGMTVSSARSFIAHQTGVDPNTPVSILFRMAGRDETPNNGDALPGDPQRITLIADSVTLPPVQLPDVTPGSTQSPNEQPTAPPEGSPPSTSPGNCLPNEGCG